VLFHDAYLRRTPWELAFATAEGMDALPDAVRQEAHARGVDPRDAGSFLTLDCVTAFARAFRGPEAESSAWIEYGMLVYHAVHFMRPERSIVLVPTAVARELTAAPGPSGTPGLPAPAGYVQLPRHFFWIRPSAGRVAEPVDGWFWTADTAGNLHIMMIAGLREDRGGFVVVPVPEAPWAEAAEWSTAQVRPDGEDFRSTLPGGELGGICSIEMSGEALKLTARIFSRLAEPRGRLTQRGPSPEPEDEGPLRSALSYVRLEP